MSAIDEQVRRILADVPQPRRPLRCRLGWHDYYFSESRMVEEKPAGPFDPRSIERRTYEASVQICAKCGKEKISPREYGYGWDL